MLRRTLPMLLLLLTALSAPALGQGDTPKAAESDAAESEAGPPEAAESEAAPPAAAFAMTPETRVSEVLVALGQERPAHWVESTPALVASGESLATTGRALTADGKEGRRVSRGFVCTDCHNLVREDPVLTVSDPEARLQYVVDAGAALLPGTTFWGMVDRESWFNQDYIKKYGALVQPATSSLEWSIQLCSSECSQGRMLEDWELKALLAYLDSLGLTIGDLALDDPTRATVEAGLASGATDAARNAAVAAIKGTYSLFSPAHTVEPPADRAAGYGNAGDAGRGRLVFENSCMTCHERGGPGTYRLSNSSSTYRELLRNRESKTNLSMYVAIRHGTRPYGVPMAYMPFFTAERLSNQQVDDLEAFFEAETAK